MAKHRQVAVILDSARAYQRKILLGIGAYVREAGNWSLYLEDQPAEQIPDLASWRGDGVILSFVNRKAVKAVSELNLPMVGIEGGAGWYDPASSIPYFSSDNRAIGRMGADHLLEQGFSRLAFCGYARTRMTEWSSERAEAFQQRAEEAGVACSIYKSRFASARKWSAFQENLAAWLKTLVAPVGLMAANDGRARHVLEACRAVGLSVPEDVAVLGVDNDEVMCELTTPPLSSIEPGTGRLGYQAAALLDRLMRGRRTTTLYRFVEPKTVVRRRSTNILAIDDSEVAAAIAYIRERACEPVSVSDVVAAVQISRSTLEARFKTAMNRTIHAEIQRVQIDRARQLIATTDMPLKQVAKLAGFAHVHYMTTVFRRHTGWTPAEYRRHAQR